MSSGSNRSRCSSRPGEVAKRQPRPPADVFPSSGAAWRLMPGGNLATACLPRPQGVGSGFPKSWDREIAKNPGPRRTRSGRLHDANAEHNEKESPKERLFHCAHGNGRVLDRIGSRQGMGDVRRATESDDLRSSEAPDANLSAPDGGEGGSVLRVLDSDGSKALLRKERRAKRKSEYQTYLQSETWRSIRQKVLDRERGVCQGCKQPATAVHHIRYPMNLGEERLEWLYALCAPCHNKIHRIAADGVPLRRATRQVLGLVPRQKKPRPKRHRKQKPPRFRLKVKSEPVRRPKLVSENDRLHKIQVRNRERREARAPRLDLSDLLRRKS